MPHSSNPNTPAAPSWLNRDFAYDADRNVWPLKANAGGFGYSDGDKSENYLLSIMGSAQDCSVMSEDLQHAMRDWPSTYHLHHQRCNLFRPIAGMLKGPILEIGAGCGVLTRFLGEAGETVFALEGSARRAAIIGARCRDLPNVSVLNANFQDLKTEQKFQTITLIGVLEYARVYFADGSDTDPVDQMLRHVAGMLAPDGVLIVAIENQMGLKYFAGFPEDHLGIPMAGIEGQYTDTSVVTFGRQELAARLSMAGLAEQRFAYPVPDYKFPEAVLFEPAMTGPHAPKFAALVAGAMASDRQRPDRVTFRLSQAARAVMQNRMGADMANSFLVMASPSPAAFDQPAPNHAVYYGNGDRKKPYLKEVRIFEKDGTLRVSRHKLTDAAPAPDAPMHHVLEPEPFVDGRHWSSELQAIMARKDWTLADICDWATIWVDALKNAAKIPEGQAPDTDTDIPGHLLDAIPKNLIVDAQGAGQFFDLEWQAKDTIALGFVIARGLFDSLSAIEHAAPSAAPIDIIQLSVEISGRLNLAMTADQIRAHFEREQGFQAYVTTRPASQIKNRLIKQQMSHRAVNKIEKHHKKLRRVFHRIRHPFRG